MRAIFFSLAIISLFTIFVHVAFAASSVTIRPNGAGTNTLGTIGTGCAANWDCTEEASNDGDTSYVKAVANSDKDTYALTDSGLASGSTINYVEVWISAKDDTSNANKIATRVRTNANEYSGTDNNPGTSYAGYFTNYSTNPQSGVAWTITEVDALESGWISADAAPDVRITQVLAVVNYNPVINIVANGTITNGAIRFTGNESATFRGSCEATGGTASNVNIILQNSTDNITFTNITNVNTEPIYANVSSYSIGSLADNSSGFLFQVNATKPGIYTLRTQCNSTDVAPYAANTTGNNLTVNQAYGYLNVSLVGPAAGTLLNATQNTTFTVNASVQCSSTDNNPTAVCEQVNGTLRRNSTADGQPNTDITTSPSSLPFWVTTNQTCGSSLNYSQNCSLNWTVSANGTIGTFWALDVNFTSNDTNVISNDTANFNVNITSAAVAADISFTLSIPAGNGTIFNVTQTTTTIIFNTTDVNGKKINATNAIGGTPVQTATVAIFRYNNTGNVAINITLNFTTALLSGIAVKAGWANGGYESPTCTAKNLTGLTACANVTGTTTLTRIANLSQCCGGGEARDVWLWADYSNLAGGTDEYRNLSSVSVEA